MSSTTSISVSEYLNTSYSPDRDFVDGRVEERNLGEHDHAAVQAALVLWFGQHQDEWKVEVLPEQRIRISATKFRVPDICLVSLDQPVEQILTKPPLACIEILSPEDTLGVCRNVLTLIGSLESATFGCWILLLKGVMTAVPQVSWMQQNSQFRVLPFVWCFPNFLRESDANS
jgi:hypothetical protein